MGICGAEFLRGARVLERDLEPQTPRSVGGENERPCRDEVLPVVDSEHAAGGRDALLGAVRAERVEAAGLGGRPGLLGRMGGC